MSSSRPTHLPSRWDLTLDILHLLALNEMDPTPLVDELATTFNVTDHDRNLKTDSGQRWFADEEVGHAKRELKEARLIDYGGNKRGPARITRRGILILATNPARIDEDFLKPLKEMQETQEMYLSELRNQETIIRNDAVELLSLLDKIFPADNQDSELTSSITRLHTNLSLLVEQARNIVFHS